MIKKGLLLFLIFSVLCFGSLSASAYSLFNDSKIDPSTTGLMYSQIDKLRCFDGSANGAELEISGFNKTDVEIFIELLNRSVKISKPIVLVGRL